MNILVFGAESSSSASNVIAIFALLVSIASIIATIILNRRQERRGYMDQFWFREVFARSCVDPVIQFREKWEQKLAAIGATPVAQKAGRALVSDLSSDATRLLQSLWIAKLFEGDFYSFCEERLEQMEDEFAQALGSSQLRGGRGTTSPLIDDVTSACAAILHRAAALHGSGLRIVT
ncbi:hypothetical protein [Dyella japonica]|uniref:DUF4760 domain-containing protein n=1 Tax=Dyella japonica A8 TaxID=1217721 RepID=A0A075K1W7_9GAMM|nr:hypothetical protein [Dyella japonica]AIF48204.1 hypothetical protein HY57_13540 [Dyella japonica A8]